MRTRSKRRYGDRCGVAHALDLVGERWALLIVRDLLLGPKRFTDLQAGLPGAGPNILTQRLHDLEDAGVVRRRMLAPPAGSRVYQLTEWGAELNPILAALGQWGARSPVVAREGGIGADSLMLTLRNSFDPQPAGSWTASYQVHVGRDSFTVRVVDGRLAEVTRGQEAGGPGTTIDTDPDTLDALLGKELPVAAALDSGRLTVTGDLEAARRLLGAGLTHGRGAHPTRPPPRPADPGSG